MSFKNLSIKNKLIVLQLCVVFVVLALSGLFLCLNDARLLRETIRTKLGSMAAMIGYNCVSALNFRDGKDAAKMLLSLEVEPQITNAWIRDAADRVFASYRQPGQNEGQPEAGMGDYEILKGRSFTLSRRILQDREVIGSVVLKYDLGAYRKILLRDYLQAGLALLGGMAIALILAFFSHRVLTVPILRLVEIIKRVSLTKDLSIRVLEERKDEIGVLSRGFDGLLAEIHSRETERDRAAAALRESEEKYRTLVESANSIILRWTPEGRINFLNEFGQRFFGYTEKELLGRHVMGSIVPEAEDGGRSLKLLMDEICRNPVAFEQNINENQLRSGEHVWIAWTNKIVMGEQGRLREILSIGQDITARKRAEDELSAIKTDLERRVGERTRELAFANKRLIELDRLKSLFLASMSHELRTPLNSILGFTGLLLMGMSGDLNGEQTKQLSMVKTSATHLLSLINDILDISKIESGKVDLSIESFPVTAVTDETLMEVTPLAIAKGLDLAVSVPEDLVIQSDRRRVKQVLMNLLGNAIKFSDRGCIRVDAAASRDQLTISVADQGIGIRPEDTDKLFSAFGQIDMSSTKQYEGTGLGLYLSKKILALLGGDISLKSEYGCGSTFTFVLPLAWKEPPHEESSCH